MKMRINFDFTFPLKKISVRQESQRKKLEYSSNNAENATISLSIMSKGR